MIVKKLAIAVYFMAALVVVAEADTTTPPALSRSRTLLNRKGLLNRANSATTSSSTGGTAGRVGVPSPTATSRTAAATTTTAPTRDPESASATGAASSDLQFEQAPVDLVLDAYAQEVGKTVLKAPECPNATITLKSLKGQKLTKQEYLEAIETILEMNQIHLEPYGERFIRAVPRKDLRKVGIPLILDSDKSLRESERVVSMMIPFKNIGIEDAQKALDNFKSNSGILIAFERTNSILATDTEMNINRMLEITRVIDIATPVLENVFVRQIKNANVTEIKTALEQIVQDCQKELEKSGIKSPVNNQATPQRQFGGGLLRGRNQPTQPTPVVNQSLVMNVSDADRGMIRGKVLLLADERSNKLVVITQKSNMDFFDKIIEQLDVETTPDTVVKVYRLKYADSEDVSDMINDLIGNSSSSKGSSKANQNQNAKKGSGGNMTTGRNQGAAAKKGANQRSGEAKAGELSKENTTVLSDKRINGLVVMTDKELVPTIEQIIESMDIKLSQVLIETVIIEVTLGDGIEAGVDWVQKGRQQVTDSKALVSENGQSIYKYYTTDDYGNRTYIDHEDWGESFSLKDVSGTSTTWTRVGDALTQSYSTIDRSSYMNNWAGATSVALGGGSGGGIAAASSIATNVLSAFSGSGLNMVFNSDELGIAAILKATKTDERAKYLASPVVMTVDNKEATIDATTARQFITGWQSTSSSYAGSGMPTPTYSSKDIGIKVKVTPKINPNGTIMLEVEEEYNQVAGKQEMLVPTSGSTYGTQKIDVPTTRKMTSDVLLDNMQTVVFGGLVEKYESESETGIPFLKDIPYVGKWLFGTTTKSENRTELLVFMTPYVLDDGHAAQVEAIRRKKTMSDARAWDDNGWSLSPLADPVSKKEQLRRLKDEWKKQDEERKTRIAIEEEKIKRAKALQEMTKDERDLWLKMHKEELEKEQQEELEKKMLDKDSQEELKKLAAEIREKKLKEAGKELKKAEEETAADNERAKLDAAKKEKKAEAGDAAGRAGVPPPAAKAEEPAKEKSAMEKLADETK